MTGQEAARKRAQEWVRNFGQQRIEHEAGTMILCLLGREAALVAERDAADERITRLTEERDNWHASNYAERRMRIAAEDARDETADRADQAVAERDRYRDALEGIETVVAEPFDGTVLRGLSSVGRAHVQSLARAALAVSTP